jgi:iron transport multicopper oxidase
MDPNVIAGGTFGIIWKNTYNTNEAFYAKPLVYTLSGYTDELVITVTNQNIVSVVDS